MLMRTLIVALAAGFLASASVHARTIGMPGGGNAGSDKTRPSGGATADLYRSSEAQRAGSNTFDASKYKTKTDCLNAASFKGLPLNLCSSLR